jgi:alanine-synthesizing transaminase
MNFTVPRPSVLVVSYPSNPTAEVVDLAFYERLVAWAKENQVWVVSDLAYSELYYDGNPTPFDHAGAGRERMWRSSLPRCPRPIRWRAGGWALRLATGS